MDPGKPSDQRWLARWLSTTALGILFGIIILGGAIGGLIEVNVQKWAERHGYDNLLVQILDYVVSRLEPTAAALQSLLNSNLFWCGFGFLAGTTALLWLLRAVPDLDGALLTSWRNFSQNVRDFYAGRAQQDRPASGAVSVPDWRRRNQLELYEIVCRSYGTLPSFDVIHRPPFNERLRLLEDAIRDGRLIAARGDVRGTGPEDGLMTQIRHVDLASFAERDVHADLLRFAEEWSPPTGQAPPTRYQTVPAASREPWKQEAPYTKVQRTYERTNFLDEGLVSLPLEKGLYVGDVAIDVPLLRENYLTLAIRCFNGSGSRARLTTVAGPIGYLFSSPDAKTIAGSGVAGELPSPHLSGDNPSEFADLAEMFIVLEQRVPSNIATQMLSALEAMEEIELALDRLHISCVFIDAEHATTRIPVWSAIKIKKASSEYIVGRVIQAWGDTRL